MNNAKNINIALIGYGFVGKTFHAPLIRSVPGLNLAFVASRAMSSANLCRMLNGATSNLWNACGVERPVR